MFNSLIKKIKDYGQQDTAENRLKVLKKEESYGKQILQIINLFIMIIISPLLIIILIPSLIKGRFRNFLIMFLLIIGLPIITLNNILLFIIDLCFLKVSKK